MALCQAGVESDPECAVHHLVAIWCFSKFTPVAALHVRLLHKVAAEEQASCDLLVVQELHQVISKAFFIALYGNRISEP